MIESFHQAVIGEVLEKWDKIKISKNNLRRAEWDALRELKSDNTLVVKKADKGEAMVIIDRTKYLEEAEKQLANQNVYKRLTSDPTTEYKQIIDGIVLEAYNDGLICNEVKTALINDQPRTPMLYIACKIHKDLEHLPGRPIVSGVNSIFQPIATSKDGYLQRIVKGLPGSKGFLQRIENIDCTEVQWLCTLDIKSLYTNIL